MTKKSEKPKPSIAVVGAGISGLGAAYLLQPLCDVTLFEAADTLGGHTLTHSVQSSDGAVDVDMGFIVFNDRTYPHFSKLLKSLGVADQPSVMSFGVSDEHIDLEYRASNLNSLFAQRKNLFNRAFYRLIRDIFRFKRESLAALAQADSILTLRDFLDAGQYSERFVSHFLVPMGAAIWSSSVDKMFDFPAHFFFRFFHNHGFLSLRDQPQWKVVQGGSHAYIPALTKDLNPDHILTQTPIRRIRRFADHVQLSSDNQRWDFDHVVIATHSDQALDMLAPATPTERDVLGAIPYQENRAVLHSDTRFMPRRKRAWASWNYHVHPDPSRPVSLTYHMNRLQSLASKQNFMVTLNPGMDVDPQTAHREALFHHPIFTPDAAKAQSRFDEINGINRTHFCGAYWRNGFHEDGYWSAIRAVECLKKILDK